MDEESGVSTAVKITFVVTHSEMADAKLRSLLRRTFGDSDLLRTLDKSEELTERRDDWAEVILFAFDGARYRLYCWRNHVTELQVLVEPADSEDLRAAADSAWKGLTRALRVHAVRLVSAEISATDRPLFSAKTGLVAFMGAPESRLGITIGLVNVLWIVIAAATFAQDEFVDLVTGAAPAITTAIILFIAALQGVFDRRLQWRN